MAHTPQDLNATMFRAVCASPGPPTALIAPACHGPFVAPADLLSPVQRQFQPSPSVHMGPGGFGGAFGGRFMVPMPASPQSALAMPGNFYGAPLLPSVHTGWANLVPPMTLGSQPSQRLYPPQVASTSLPSPLAVGIPNIASEGLGPGFFIMTPTPPNGFGPPLPGPGASYYNPYLSQIAPPIYLGQFPPSAGATSVTTTVTSAAIASSSTSFSHSPSTSSPNVRPSVATDTKRQCACCRTTE